MEIKDSTLKIFLTSGVTLTKKFEDKIFDRNNKEIKIEDLVVEIERCINKEDTLVFIAEMKHEEQTVKHYYHIPHDRISWFMLEEV